MEELLRDILFDERITNLVGNKIYLLKAPDNTAGPYIEYEVLNEEGSLYAENEEIETNYRIQIDIYTQGNYEEIVKTIKSLMKENKFMKEFGGSLFEEKTKLFHYVLRFNYEREE